MRSEGWRREGTCAWACLIHAMGIVLLHQAVQSIKSCGRCSFYLWQLASKDPIKLGNHRKNLAVHVEGERVDAFSGVSVCTGVGIVLNPGPAMLPQRGQSLPLHLLEDPTQAPELHMELQTPSRVRMQHVAHCESHLPAALSLSETMWCACGESGRHNGEGEGGLRA